VNNQQTIGIKIAIDAASGRAEVVGLSGDLLKLEGAGQKVHSTFTRLGPAVGSALAGIALAEVGRELLQTATKFDSLNKSAVAVAGSAPAAAAQLEFVRNTSRTLGLSLLDSAKAYNSLAASAKGTALEGAGAQQIFTAVAKAASALGLSTDEANGALLAIGQMMSKGTVASEELRGQLGERLPGAFQIAARAMGASTAELSKMLEQGQVLSTDFLPKFAAELDKTYSSARFDGIQNNLNRLTSSWDAFKSSIADTLPFNTAIQALTSLVDSANQAMNSPSRWEEFQGRHSWMKPPVGIASEGFTGAAFNKAAGVQSSKDAFAGSIVSFDQFSAGLSRANTGPSKGGLLSALELAEAQAKQAHNLQALAAAKEQLILLDGKETAENAKSIAMDKAKTDALGWTASASKALETTQASLAEKINDVVAGYDMQIAALGMSAREAAAFEGEQKVLIGLNAKELEQLRQKPEELDKIRQRALDEYDLLQKKEEVMRRIADFDSRQGIANGLTMQADRAQRELSTLRGLQDSGLSGERLQREMSIQRMLMDKRQEYTDNGSKGEDLAANMAQAEQNIRSLEASTWEANKALNETNDLGHSIGMTFASAFEDAIVQGKSFSDVLKGIGQDLVRLTIRSAITKPLSENAGSWITSGLKALPGLFGFADGGVMTGAGPLPLHAYASGGIANRPQVALFGEGRMPEAFVPLPDGRSIPVTMQGGGGGTVVQVIDQRQGGAAIEQQRSTDASGVEVIRLIVRDEVQRNVPGAMRMALAGGTLDKDFAGSFGLRRTGR
jgi:tape measure domain-containing protein